MHLHSNQHGGAFAGDRGRGCGSLAGEGMLQLAHMGGVLASLASVRGTWLPHKCERCVAHLHMRGDRGTLPRLIKVVILVEEIRNEGSREEYTAKLQHAAVIAAYYGPLRRGRLTLPPTLTLWVSAARGVVHGFRGCWDHRGAA